VAQRRVECRLVAIKLEYRAVFISDLHLGSRGSRARELSAFLKRIRCGKLYLVGDVIDMWRLRSRWFWPRPHNKVVRRLIRMANRRGTEVIYIPGNHDEHARQFTGLTFGDIRTQRRAEHTTADGRRLLVTHGDEFDLIVQNHRLISLLGAWGYDWLVTLNRLYNRLRERLGLPYRSLSQAIKLRVKRACQFVSDFEATLCEVAKHNGFDGVVCGHIHKAEARPHGAIEYYNCGDWVESCTALVEHDDGKLQLIDGIAVVEQLREQERALKAAAASGPAQARSSGRGCPKSRHHATEPDRARAHAAG
jgi:UDP-2,3-diacylglucosamine pyrophosphatase LpxH